jgi:ParB family chromosome partitioning protein
VAKANAETTAKVQRTVLVDCVTGSNGRERIEGWLPKWFAFPPSGYAERGGIACVERNERIAMLFVPAEVEEEPEIRQAA